MPDADTWIDPRMNLRWFFVSQRLRDALADRCPGAKPDLIPCREVWRRAPGSRSIAGNLSKPTAQVSAALTELAHMSAQKTWWAEDFTPGLTFETPGRTMTEAAIIEYASHYDPQPFHTDVTAAEASIYGGLIASGFHTLSTAFRLWQGMGIINPASQGAPGMDEVKWHAPVRPGDTIRGVVKVTSQRISASRPHLGIVGWRTEVFNQRGELVMSFAGPAMYLRRPENRGA